MSIIEKNGLKISSNLFEFINKEVLPDTNIETDEFWNKFEKAVHELAPINKKLIEKREDVQKKIDEWHIQNKGKEFNKKEYTEFLKSISYILKKKKTLILRQLTVDDEIPQLRASTCRAG